MATWVVVLLLLCLFGWAVYKVIQKLKKGGSCCGEHEETLKRVSVQDRNRNHYSHKAVLSIGGMTCENCAIRVENSLNRLPGTWAKADIAENKAEILMKTEPDENILRDAVASAGYVVMAVNTEKL